MMIRTNRLPDATTRGQKRRFTVRSQLVTVSGRTIRHIVIFDNHPDSLRLLLNSDFIPRRRNEFFYALLTIVLVPRSWPLGMFWVLCFKVEGLRAKLAASGLPKERALRLETGHKENLRFLKSRPQNVEEHITNQIK